MQNNGEQASNLAAWTEEDDRLLEQYVAMGKAVQDGTYHNRPQEFALPALLQESAPPAPKGVMGHLRDGVDGTLDVAKGMLHGPARAVEELATFSHDVGVAALNQGRKAANFVMDRFDFFDDYYRLDPIESDWEADWGARHYEPKFTLGKLASGATQFATGFGLTGGALKALGIANKAAQAGPLANAAINTLGKGMLTDAAFFAPDERLADVLAQVPILEKLVPEFLLSGPDDTRMEGRLKNALEGVFVGGAVDAVFAGIRALKRLHGADIKLDTDAAKALRKDVEEAVDAVDGIARQIAGETPMPGTPMGKSVAKTALEATQTASQKYDVDLEAFVREYDRLVKSNAPLSEFQTLKSIRNNIHTADDVHRVIDALEADGVFKRDPDMMRTVSFEETTNRAYHLLERANATGLTREEFVEAIGSGLGDELAEAPSKIVLLNDLMMDTAQDLAAALKTGDIIDVDTALDKVIGVTFQYDRVQTGAGRTLQIFDPLSRRGSGIMKFLGIDRQAAKMIGPEETARVAKEMIEAMTPQQKYTLSARLSAMKDIPSMAQAMRLHSRTGKFAVMHNEVWINLILSGMRTQSSNVLSNMYMTAIHQPLVKMVGAPASALRNGKWTQEEVKVLREGLLAWQGICESAVDSFRIAHEAFKLGENILKPGASVIEENARAVRAEAFGKDPASVIGRCIDALGDAVRLPSRFLIAGDEFSSQLTYRAGERVRARIQAEDLYARKKLTGGGSKAEIIEKFVEDSYNRTLVDKVFDDGSRIAKAVGIKDGGLGEAMDATFTTPLAFGGIADDIQKMATKHPLIRRFFAPFVRTPLNIVKNATIDSTPFALPTAAYKEALSAGPRQAAIARGRVALGTLTYITAGMMAFNGVITGGGPANKKQRDMLYEKGWRPYSVKIGDRYVSYKSVEPIATILGIAADAMEVLAAADPDSSEGQKIAETISSLPYSIYNAVSSKTFMRTMSETFSMLHNPKEAGNWLEGQAISYNPAFLRQLKTVLDPELREAQTFVEKWKNATPMLSETLPQKYSWLTGEPLSVYGGRSAAFSPIVSEYSPDDPVAAELMKYSEQWMDEGGIKWEDSYTVRGVKMDAQQRSDWDRLQGTVKIGGKTLHQALEKLFASAEYDRGTPIDRSPRTDDKFLMIDKTIHKYRDAARVELFGLHDNLRSVAGGSKRNDSLKKNAKQASRKQDSAGQNRTAEMLKNIAEL